jgi:ketosteroid isomerase-like protein
MTEESTTPDLVELTRQAFETAGRHDVDALDLVRSFYAAWERGDFSSVDWAHPDIEFAIADRLSPASWTGLAGMADGWRDFLIGWADFRAEPEEYRELDHERVLVLTRNTGRGKTRAWSSVRCGHMERACSTSATAR